MLDLFNQESQFKRYVECYAESYGDEREQRGIDIGREQGTVVSIRNLMQSLKLTAPQAMDTVNIAVVANRLPAEY